LTPTGRIQRQYSGRCLVPLPVIALPICVTEAYGYHEWKKGNIHHDRGSNCPLWEENTGKPQPIT
jgi:hypothetical protein